MQITMRNMAVAIKHDLCAACLSTGKNEKATSRELSSCNNPDHVKELRPIYRSATRSLRRVFDVA